ncbi:MAG: GT2 family glycosyltransferase [Verrucomicrobiales bacterium]|jgi:GT2 family glycosyltransferase
MLAQMSSPQPHAWKADGKFLQLGGEHAWLRGITYGPFDSGRAPHGLPSPDQYHRDLDQICELGANTLRLTRSPTHEFLAACDERGLQTLIGLNWEDFVDFFHDPAMPPRILRSTRRVVSEFHEAPAVSGYFVGNEVNAQLVRWLGRDRVKSFLEAMIEAGRNCHPGTLFAYASYPTTEYLMPDNADFVAYNVYLEKREDFARYLRRLQHLAGNRPLVISEFGLDTRRNSTETQRETLDWACEEMAQQGVAGTILFTFTDEWFTGGRDMSDWQFGLVDCARQPKPAFNAVREHYQKGAAPLSFLTRIPKISVIVCTFNGVRTLNDCLRWLGRVNYPDFEVLVVDDGSMENVRSIVEKHKSVRYIKQKHTGLSAARNLGAKKARGEILAYTDDDCMPDRDWLAHLALAFQRDPEVAAVGGPNLPPPAENVTQACVIAAPGAPAHVMLNDADAEHIPGCNLSVRRTDFDEINGFEERYNVAGDDVDFCWRLQISGKRIGFAPAAFVWHYRRFSTRAYLKQQTGYGRAEAMLMKQHSKRFSLLSGGARWFGTVYQPDALATADGSTRLYQGVFGNALFQFIYPEAVSCFTALVSGFPWALLALVLLLAGIVNPPLSLIGLAMLAVTAWQAWKRTRCRRIDPRFESRKSRALLWLITLIQPIARGATRSIHSLRLMAIPRGPILGSTLLRFPQFVLWKKVGQIAVWSGDGKERDALLTKIIKELDLHSWKHKADDGWNDWDIEVKRSFWWHVRVTTVTEYHTGKNRLTRVRMASHMSPANTIFSLLLLAGIIATCWTSDWRAMWIFGFGIYFLWWLLLEVKHQAIVSRCMRLILTVAEANGYEPTREEKDPMPDRPA